MKEKVEYLIIGNGLAGTMLAFEMLQNNIDFKIVASIEKSKASMVAAGMVNPLVFKRLTKSWLVDDLLPVMFETFAKLEHLLGQKFYFNKDILKPLSEQEKELWLERKQNPEFSKYIFSVNNDSNLKYLSGSAGYGRVTNSGYFNLGSFLNASEYFFRSKNLLVDSTVNPEEFDISAKSFEIGNWSAAKIVFCEGHHLIHNHLFRFVKMSPTKGEVLLLEAPGLSEEFILNKKVFVLPVGNGLFKVGSTYDWKDLSEKTTENGKASIVERFENLVNVSYTIKNHFAGVRPTIADRRPVLGFHPENKNIAVFNGLGTKGVMLAPYFAKEMLKAVSSENYTLDAGVDLQRFLSKL